MHPRRLPIVALSCVATALLVVLACAPGNGSVESKGTPLLTPNDSELARSAPDSFRVDLQTSRGPITLVAHRAWAPHGVDRFYYLTKHGYYDSTYFFRVIENFVAQFGISGSPSISAAWQNRRIPDDPVRHPNTRGTVAFASQGPNSR